MKNQLFTLLSDANKASEATLVEKDLKDYVDKLLKYATIVTVGDSSGLQAFIAYYDNNTQSLEAFLSMIVVGKEFRGKGYGKRLIAFAEENLRTKGFKKFTLEVRRENLSALRLYEALLFKTIEVRDSSFILSKEL